MSALIEDTAAGARARRRELLADGALAVGLAAFVTLGTFFASQNQPARRPFDAGAVALIVRRRFPVAVLLVVFGSVLAYHVIGFANGPIWLTLILAYVTAVLRGHRVAAGVVAVAGFAIFPWLDFLLRDGTAPSLLEFG